MLAYYIYVPNMYVQFLNRVDFRPYNQSALLLFQGSDANHDGIFSRQELDNEFVKYDANGLKTWVYNKRLNDIQITE